MDRSCDVEQGGILYVNEVFYIARVRFTISAKTCMPKEIKRQVRTEIIGKY